MKTTNYNLPFTELYFYHVANQCKYEINEIVKRFKSDDIDLDSQTLGWWVLDFRTDEAVYSDKFKYILGANDLSFPDHPLSWRQHIKPNDLKIALSNMDAHIQSKGLEPYTQTVTYNKVDGTGQVTVICHGIVVKWSDDNKPELMIGLHFNQYGLLEFDEKKSTPLYFNSIKSMPLNQEIELFKGCLISVIHKELNRVILFCKMGLAADSDKACTLPEHYHPDYVETFYTISGELVDLTNNKLISIDNEYELAANTDHTMHCPLSWIGKINIQQII